MGDVADLVAPRALCVLNGVKNIFSLAGKRVKNSFRLYIQQRVQPVITCSMRGLKVISTIKKAHGLYKKVF